MMPGTLVNNLNRIAEQKRQEELVKTNHAILKELRVANTLARASDPLIPKCPVCKVPIEGRADKVYCGNACKATSSRERRRKTRHG